MWKSQRISVAGLAALVSAAAVAAPGHAAVAAAAAPGPWCGGTLWKLMTLSDTGTKSVTWAPTATSIPDIAKLAAPARVPAARSTAFTKRVWQLTAIVERYRIASNGEIVLQLFDVPSGTYMNAYMPNPKCLSAKTRGRASILAARTAFTSACPAPTPAWQMLGATAQLSGVGFWNPVRTTLGALANGAELRPVTGFTLQQGCGK